MEDLELTTDTYNYSNFFRNKKKSKISLLENRDRCSKFVHALVCVCEVRKKEPALGEQCQSIMEGNILSDNLLCSVYIATLTLILPRSRTGTVWFYTSTSNKRAARPKLYTKSLTRDLKLMYHRFTLVRISIKL